MSTAIVYGGAVIIFIIQLLCCFSENRIIGKLPFAAAAFPAFLGVGYRLFYDIRTPWKGFVTAVYLYVALVWLVAALVARIIYKFVMKHKK